MPTRAFISAFSNRQTALIACQATSRRHFSLKKDDSDSEHEKNKEVQSDKEFDDERLECEPSEEEQTEEECIETESEYEQEGQQPQISDCFYQTLGVAKDANKDDIRAAYLSKAREFHPDKRPECLEFFTHVTKAYDTLYDDHKRAIYDDESIPDEEYFTLQIGETKINLFSVIMAVSMVGMSYVAYVQYFGVKQAQQAKGCPIDHSSRNEMVQIARKKGAK